MISVVSFGVEGDSASLKASLQKTSSIFISIDTLVNILIFFSGYFIKEKPRKTSYGALHFLNKVAQREDSDMDRDPPRNLASLQKRESTEDPEEQNKLQSNDVSSIQSETSNSLTVRFKTEDSDKTIRFPKWVVDEYGTEESEDGTSKGGKDDTSKGGKDDTLNVGNDDTLNGGNNEFIEH
jgi:hypothetical protein